MPLFIFAKGHRHIFCSSWNQGIREKSRKENCIAWSKSIFKKSLPNWRSVILKERDSVNNTANLSTWRHLTNQSMIPRIWYHGTAASKACLLADIFPIWPRFLPFSPIADPGPRLPTNHSVGFVQVPRYGNTKARIPRIKDRSCNLSRGVYKIHSSAQCGLEKGFLSKYQREIWRING